MLKDTGERLILNGNWNVKTELEHIHRYTAVAECVKGMNVLDAACGSGYGTAILAEKAANVIGIDISQDAIDFATQTNHIDNLHYMQMSIEKLRFPDNSFDAVVSFETIEHVPAEIQRAFLREVKRVLKDDGFFIISTPNDALLRRQTYGAYTNEFHVHEFTEKEFDEFLREQFEYTKFYYQTVSLESSIIPQNHSNSFEGKIYCYNDDSEDERFYIAFCSNKKMNYCMQSSMRPELKRYYDEHYYTWQASLYFDTGAGFDGKAFKHEKCISYNGKKFHYHFDFSDINGIKGIRFDPAEHAGKYKIISVNADIGTVTIESVNAVAKNGDIDTFDTMDPIYYIKYSSPEISTLDIDFEIVSQIPDYIAWDMLEQRKTSIQAYADKLSIDNDETSKKIRGISTQLNELRDKNSDLELKLAQNETIYQKEKEELIEEYALKYEKICNKCFEEISRLEVNLSKSHDENDVRSLETTIKSNIQELVETSDKIHHTVEDINYSLSKAPWYKNVKIDESRISFGKKIMLGVYGIAIKSIFIRKTLNNVVVAAEKIPILGDAIQNSVLDTIDKYYAQDAKKNSFYTADVNINDYDIIVPHDEKPLVSIIVPCYNHASYLRQRLDTIYSQTYNNFEVILLDDCSTDESRDILCEYAEMHSDNTICDFNNKNVGKVFLQWNKGLSHASGSLIWIAESDDWSQPDFLETMVKQFAHQSVMLSFAPSKFMQEGKEIWDTAKYLFDTDFEWNHSWILTAHNALKRGFANKNIIPNVSSCVFRNPGEIPNEVVNLWRELRLCGDWIFYLYIIKGGTLAYTPETINYYRVHSKSTSIKVQHDITSYYSEQLQVSKYIVENYNVNIDVFNKTKQILEQHYIDNGFGHDKNEIDKWYRIDDIKAAANNRKKNILICNFDMIIGGGEVFPIYLANALRTKGYPVTMVNCMMDKIHQYDQKVRNMLDNQVPLICLREPLDLRKVVSEFGIDVVHSHHASVDKLISEYLKGYGISQVITLHGMYEAIPKKICTNLLECVTETCSIFAYISDKNLVPFKENGVLDKCTMKKVKNGITPSEVTPIERKSLNIPEESFVFCIVSRGLLEKGWVEACEAVQIINTKMGDDNGEIHLVIVGDGEATSKIEKYLSLPYIHAVGMKDNPRDYFAMADMGLLPSYYSGESFPLTIIECLMAGKPVMATDVGEIPNMIKDNDQNDAGILLHLENGKVNVNDLAEAMFSIASNKEMYHILKERVLSVAKQYDIDTVADTYIEIYNLANKKI